MALLQGKILDLEAEYYKLPEAIMKYDRLKYIEKLNNKYFTLFTEKKIEYTLSNAGYSSTNRVLSNPVKPRVPMTPNREIVYGFALALGLIFGLSYLLLKYVTYNDIVGSEDLLNLLPEGTNYLGGVPYYKRK